MDIFEMIESAKQSEYGAIWYSEKGPIQISKEGNLEPIKMAELPKYQPERSKREDLDLEFLKYRKSLNIEYPKCIKHNLDSCSVCEPF